MSAVIKREIRRYANDNWGFELITHSNNRVTVNKFINGQGNMINKSYSIDRPSMTLDEAEDYLRVVERLEKARP